MRVSLYSEKGKNKERCEDICGINNIVISGEYTQVNIDGDFIVAVADGVGGNAGGEIASKYVIEGLLATNVNMCSEEQIKNAILRLNTMLLDYANKSVGMESMATTLTGIKVIGENAFVFHLGNTRIYMMQGNYLKQITEDQTTYQWLMNLGQYDAADNCNKCEIRFCMGGGNNQFVNGLKVYSHANICNASKILLTTDGIHDYVSLDELELFIQGDMNKSSFMALAEQALKNGSTDDRTIIVLDRM